MLPGGDVCVADTNNHRLQVLSRSGEVRGVIGRGPGSGSGDFQQPTGLACDGTFLYVADSGNCRLCKLSLRDAKPIETIGSFGDQPGQLHAPVGLALYESPSGESFLFCADSRNHRVAIFCTIPEFRFVRTFGSHGTGGGQLGPTSSGIYLAASEGELFVADRANNRLQVTEATCAYNDPYMPPLPPPGHLQLTLSRAFTGPFVGGFSSAHNRAARDGTWLLPPHSWYRRPRSQDLYRRV